MSEVVVLALFADVEGEVGNALGCGELWKGSSVGFIVEGAAGGVSAQGQAGGRFGKAVGHAAIGLRLGACKGSG